MVAKAVEPSTIPMAIADEHFEACHVSSDSYVRGGARRYMTGRRQLQVHPSVCVRSLSAGVRDSRPLCGRLVPSQRALSKRFL
jgi:hypothetical protein